LTRGMPEPIRKPKRLVPALLPSDPVVESPVPGSDPQPHNTRLVYGELGGELVFIPQARADELSAVRLALGESKTWGELLERLAACSAEAHEYITQYLGDDGAAADDPFNRDQIGAIGDGDWPPWPQQEMLGWVPDDIRERFGQIKVTIFNGEALVFTEDQAASLVADFEAKGFIVTRDDVAVAAASGW
jgi:hypothetical protein